MTRETILQLEYSVLVLTEGLTEGCGLRSRPLDGPTHQSNVTHHPNETLYPRQQSEAIERSPKGALALLRAIFALPPEQSDLTL